MSCKRKQCNQYSAAKDASSCPSNSFCLQLTPGLDEGVCCPQRLECPFGEPLSGRTCNGARTDSERCPQDSHQCYETPQYSGSFVCCPRVCPGYPINFTVVIDGQCYPQKLLNEACEKSQQCIYAAECRNKMCQCPVRYSQSLYENLAKQNFVFQCYDLPVDGSHAVLFAK